MFSGSLFSSEPLRPGSRLGVYPQRLESPARPFERIGREWLDRARAQWFRHRYDLARVVSEIDAVSGDLASLDERELLKESQKARYSLHREGLEADPVFRGFALVREYADRVLGLRHYNEQLFGGWVIVNGNMAEMATGEGKSLTATLPAATAALAGIPVHLITTNEYLAQRDAEQFRPLYEALGLSVSVVLESMSTEQRQQAYQSDIVYCTNKQVAFDYLRDRLVSRNESGRLSLKFGEAYQQGRLVLRGLCFAIIDEADSVLVDEARTPLILSKEHHDECQQAIYEQALEFARQMNEGEDFQLLQREHRVVMTDRGEAWLARQTMSLEGIWAGKRHGRYLVQQALTALHLHQRDSHYLVRDGKVEIIDRNTGRTQADRTWQHGLHQMIECKEALEITGQRETLASISYQRFFRRYLQVGGMSGTLQQVSSEMRSIYWQRVVSIPEHRPCRRAYGDFTVYRRSPDKWLAVIRRMEAVHATGQPVLVGTASVADSELLSSFLARKKIEHRVLNARQDSEEAAIVAEAGLKGRITIATNMAGRGTDIKLGPGVAELGGLHVIVAECNEEYRVDRQLYGRCARQGDPGSCETLMSLNDALVQQACPLWMRRLLGSCMESKHSLSGPVSRVLAGLLQWLMARRFRAQRRALMYNDEKLGKMLSYSGRQE